MICHSIYGYTTLESNSRYTVSPIGDRIMFPKTRNFDVKMSAAVVVFDEDGRSRERFCRKPQKIEMM